MELFKIRCTTCQTKLRVQDPAAVGEIVACPKCNSMVLIDPPVDWVPPKIVPGADSKRPIVAVTTDSSGVLAAGSSSQSQAEKPEPSSGTDALRPSAEQSTAEKQTAPNDPSGLHEADYSEPVDDLHLSPTEQLSRKLTLLLILPAVALFAFTIYWTFASLRSGETAAAKTEAPAEIEKVEAKDDQGDRASLDGEGTVDSPFLVRWVPQDAAYVVRIGPAVLRTPEKTRVVIESTLSTFREALDPLLQAVRSVNLTIDSLQCAGISLGRWKDNSLFVVRLSTPAEEVAEWFASGKPTDIKVAGVPCRVFESGRWPYPFALIGEKTLLTGSPEILASNDLGTQATQVSPGLAELLGQEMQALDENTSALRFVADLSQNRDKVFNWLPDWVAEQSSATDACVNVNTIPQGVDLQVGDTETPTLSFALRSSDEQQATLLRQALQEIVVDLGTQWKSDIADLEQQAESGRLPEPMVEQVRGVLSQGMAVLQTASILEDGLTTKATFTLPGSLDHVASSFLDTWASRQRFHEVQSLESDVNHQHTILAGLTTATGSEGYWPLGAAGAVQLPAETRLSWIASMLPYLEGNDIYPALYEGLNFFRSWNDPANLEVARTPVPLFTNPRLGASVTAAGFPTTNYVGMAGLGADAASLDPADPRAGVFNVRHRVLLDDIKDGLSHTIAVMGVTGRLGPWAAGGDGTVRPLTAQPYVGGPDHFGSGMTGGMLVGMADGSVQFIAEDVDPHVMEQLVTINGGAMNPQVAAKALIPAARYLKAGSQVEETESVEEEMEPVEPPVKAAIAYDPEEVEANASASAILETELAAIDFVEATLDDFVEFMSQLTTVNINFDLDAMSDAGIGTNDTLSVQLQAASYRAILDAALRPLGLGVVLRQGELAVTTLPSRTNLQRVAVYSVADLCGEQAEAYEQLAHDVQSIIEPGAWSTVGGPSRLEIEGDALIVEANEQVHLALATFLKKLRLARRMANGEADPSEIALVSRVFSAVEALQTPVDLQVDNPTPLSEIVKRLQTDSRVNLLIDRAALDAAGLTPEVEVTLQAAGSTLGQALERLCAPFDLTYTIINANTIWVTTLTTAAASMEVELYPVAALLAKRVSRDEIIDRIQTDIAPQSWRETGGPASLVFVDAAKCLIVRQSQQEQAQIESLLGELMARQSQQ